MTVEVDPHLLRRELRDRQPVEDLALDRAALDHRPFIRGEPVDPRLQKRLDRRRHLDLAVAAFLAQHQEHLLDEERVPLRRFEDPRPRLVRERGLPEQVVDQ